MYKLYGIKTTYTPCYDERECREDVETELVAIFDTNEQALKYVDNARLKHPIRQTWTNDYYFRNDSLLAGCGDYEIILDDTETVPRNPEIKEKK